MNFSTERHGTLRTAGILGMETVDGCRGNYGLKIGGSSIVSTTSIHSCVSTWF